MVFKEFIEMIFTNLQIKLIKSIKYSVFYKSIAARTILDCNVTFLNKSNTNFVDFIYFHSYLYLNSQPRYLEVLTVNA